MFKTENDLTEAVRAKAVDLLNARLADAIDLQTQTKQAHWNVKGPNFIALHELFEKVNEDVEDYVDDIAERAAQRSRRNGPDGCKAIIVKRVSRGRRGGPQSRRGALVGRRGIRKIGAERHQRRERSGRSRHGPPLHRDLARHGQMALVRRSAPASRTMTRRRKRFNSATALAAVETDQLHRRRDALRRASIRPRR